MIINRYPAQQFIFDKIKLGIESNTIDSRAFAEILAASYCRFEFLYLCSEIKDRFETDFGVCYKTINGWCRSAGEGAPSLALRIRIIKWWRKPYETIYGLE